MRFNADQVHVAIAMGKTQVPVSQCPWRGGRNFRFEWDIDKPMLMWITSILSIRQFNSQSEPAAVIE